MKRLVALVLHLAEQLYAEEQNNPGAGNCGASKEGHDNDTPDTSTIRG
ncbi:MAG: hypothetical protein VB036_10760 [Propionicimonas sp.]|nr:hypothetical protein [Propionicimonas sp.]